MGALKTTAASLTALAISASAFAGPDLDTRVQELEKKVDMMSTKTAMGTYGPKLACARAEPNGEGWFINLDVLYWHAKVGGTEYSYTNAFQPNGENPLANGRLREIDFNWDFGLKVGAGYNFYHDGWDASIQYTYFDSNGGSRTLASRTDTVIPNRGNNAISDHAGVYQEGQSTVYNSAFNSCDRATSDYNFDFDAIEVELGKSFFVSRSLSLRPHFGLKSLWLDILQQTRFSGGTAREDGQNYDVSGLGANTVFVTDKNNVWGLGPRAGFDSKWYLTNGFSFYGNTAGSLLFGYFDTHHKNWFSIDTEDHTVRLKSKMHRFIPMFELGLGLAYDQYIYNDKQHISVSLGYEVQYMFRANQSIKPDYRQADTLTGVEPNMTYTRYSEDAMVYGVTFEVKWSF